MKRIHPTRAIATFAIPALMLGSATAVVQHDTNVANISPAGKANVVVIQESDAESEGTEFDIETPLETEVIEYDESDMAYLAMQSEGIDLAEQGRATEAIYTWKTRHSEYIPASGASLNWSESHVYKNDQDIIVDVPFIEGLDFVSKVVFTWSDGALHTQEVFSTMESANQLHIYSWLDGEAIVDTIVKNEETDSSIVTAGALTTLKPAKGPNWSRFNRCLSNHGIGWAAVATISVVCGAACAATAGVGCAACLFAQSGATGGIIGLCLSELWK